MRLQTGLLLTCAAGALMIGAGAPSKALAADKAVLPAPATDMWWYTGEVEVGGRFFLNNPQRDGVSAFGGSSLAKYYEYSSIKPGAFANGWAWMGSKDGLYEVDLYGKNVGYTDQRFVGDFSKAGEHYFTFMWDETPHVYSTSARTIYNGVGTNALTLVPGLAGGQLFGAAGCSQNPGNQPNQVAGGCGSPLQASNANQVAALINSNAYQTDIGIRRDTAAGQYRYTPTDSWDFRADYSHTRRTGTQVEGVTMSPGTSGVVSQVPKPVADTTQNFGASGEYNGISPWNQKFNFKVAYNGSLYRDDWDSYTVQNPFCPVNAGPGECARNGQPSSPLARMSLWPDNQANGVTGTLGADLPVKSRYMGTLSWVDMQQNQPFIPFTISPTVYNSTAYNLASQVAPPTLSATSLNGDISTLLSNNVVTTQITPEIKSKATYRYYDFRNGTPEIHLHDWVETDVITALGRNAGHGNVSSLSMSYKRQDASEELTYQPTREWNFGATYQWERYDRTREDVDVTKENTGKGFIDWKPFGWLTARASGEYGQRRYNNYDYLTFVGNAQWPNSTSRYSPAYRQFFLDNRDRAVAKGLLDIDFAPGLTITPSIGYRDDSYNLDPTKELGLIRDRGWNAGVDVAWLMFAGTRFVASYMYENRDQIISQNATLPSNNYTRTTVGDRVNTLVAALDQNVIPNKLDVRVSYTVAYAVDSQPTFLFNGTGPSAATGGNYPDVKSMFQRLDASAKYKFDEDAVHKMGIKGNIYAKLRYAWERNSVVNWQNDVMQTYMYAYDNQTGYQTYLAYDNPNYNVHLFAASLAWAW